MYLLNHIYTNRIYYFIIVNLYIEIILVIKHYIRTCHDKISDYIYMFAQVDIRE